MALSVVWAILTTLSLIFAIRCGTASAVSAAALEGAAEGIRLSLALAGTLCLWSGVCRVLEAIGLNRFLAARMRPLLRRLFPKASRDPNTLGSICGNLSANLLGLGNAATPLGIDAVRRMGTQAAPGIASDEMCRFIVLNTASIQLLPTTVAAVRLAKGAASPFDILPAVWVTSLFSVTAGLLAAWLFGRRRTP